MLSPSSIPRKPIFFDTSPSIYLRRKKKLTETVFKSAINEHVQYLMKFHRKQAATECSPQTPLSGNQNSQNQSLSTSKKNQSANVLKSTVKSICSIQRSFTNGQSSLMKLQNSTQIQLTFLRNEYLFILEKNSWLQMYT